jgi:hypothetical protein
MNFYCEYIMYIFLKIIINSMSEKYIIYIFKDL